LQLWLLRKRENFLLILDCNGDISKIAAVFCRFSAKLVNLYLTTFRYDEWEKFSQELQDMDVTVANFTQTLRSVDQRIQVATAGHQR
jgi:hypothetical protein